MIKNFLLPKLAEGIELAKVSDVVAQEGDFVNKNDTLLVLESDKASMEIPAEESGLIKEILVSPGDEVVTGTLLVKIEQKGSVVHKGEELQRKQTLKESQEKESRTQNAVDSSKNEPHLINKEKIWSKDDSKLSEVKKEHQNQYDLGKDKQLVQIKDLTSIKISEIKNLSSVNTKSLNVTLSANIDYNKLKKNNADIWNESINPSPTPLILFHVYQILKDYSLINSYFEKDKIYIYNKINIGVAIDLGMGLKVVKLNLYNKNVSQIQNEILVATKKYLSNELTPLDMQGITFTVSDLFNDAVSFFTPLINYHNSAILGVCALSNNSFNVVITFDHRVTDGKYCAKFLNELKRRIEGV